MQRVLRGIGRELAPTLALAGPVVLAELGWVAMGVVDTLIVGRLGAEEIGAVSVGGVVFFTLAVFGMGMLLGLDTLVAQAFGAGKADDCRRSLVQGLYLALVLTPPLTALALGGGTWLAPLGVDPRVLRLAAPYLRATAWSLGPLLVFAAFRRYAQATGRVAPFVFALVSANAINVLANWVLVFGHLGAPVLGVTGSGWATTISRVYMAAVLAALVLRREGKDFLRVPFRPDPVVLKQLVRLGWPAALQVTLEVGVFATATVLAGSLDPVSLAAHQVVMSVASVTFMIPLGLASAAAVRVGQALGRHDPEAAARAGDTAIALGAAFMTTAALVFLLVPSVIVAPFTAESLVVATGVTLLRVAACFQLFDGLQGVTTGALRGAGDTRTPMLVNLLAHWTLGLPVGAFLAFRAGLGVAGLWIGLSLGLIVAGLYLLRVWAARSRTLGLLLVPLAKEPPGGDP